MERIKLTANYLNTIAAGFAVTGIIGPAATYLYGTSQTSRPLWALGLEVVLPLVFSIALHLNARRLLGELDR